LKRNDSRGAGSLGPDRRWFAADASGKLQGNIRVFAEDGVTPLATGSITLSAGKAYVLVLQSAKVASRRLPGLVRARDNFTSGQRASCDELDDLQQRFS